MAVWLVGAAGSIFLIAALGASGGRSESGPTARIGNCVFHLEIVSGEAAATGLTGRSRLAANGGMLFELQAEASARITMTDTTIPLALVLVDRADRVIGLRSLSPNGPIVDVSLGAVRALELPSDAPTRCGIRIGARVAFANIDVEPMD